jgi:hypothetical protein
MCVNGSELLTCRKANRLHLRSNQHHHRYCDAAHVEKGLTNNKAPKRLDRLNRVVEL